ncbi:MAG TPA: PmeII family type II restriction endonuclease [Phycisphaerae bacterium]|nr:PmeII family type II restriction endonuclease [Phycisphaerae bacterium]
MGRGHPGLPRVSAYSISKTALLSALQDIDSDNDARQRILTMETEFRQRITQHVQSLPMANASFAKFRTSPFVLLFQCLKKQYKHIYEIEADILPAKVFSSMETSAGRMVEAVVLPIYSWECVESKMHSTDSVLDGRSKKPGELRLATLKSGPICLNDEMSKDIAEDIIANAVGWAREAAVDQIDFTYGVLYGTKKQSHKKDWHILRNICEKLRDEAIVTPATGRWNCAFQLDGIDVEVTVRVGCELWDYIADREHGFVEVCVALIRACVTPSDADPKDYEYTISDLRDIISLDVVPDEFNVGILQRSQLEWLFFVARHFCDSLRDG